MDLPRVLIINADPELALLARSWLAGRAVVLSATNTHEGDAILAEAPVEVLVCHDNLLGETGIMFLARHTSDTPWTRRVLICAPLEPDLLLHVFNEANVFRCLVEPCSDTEIQQQIERALTEAKSSRAIFSAAARAELPANFVHSWIRMLPRIAFLTLLTCAGVLIVGLGTLLLLYLLKSLAGIDLFSDAHLSDLWR